MGGGGNLLVLSVTPVAELAVITNSDTAKSWCSGASSMQLLPFLQFTAATLLHSQHGTKP